MINKNKNDIVFSTEDGEYTLEEVRRVYPETLYVHGPYRRKNSNKIFVILSGYGRDGYKLTLSLQRFLLSMKNGKDTKVGREYVVKNKEWNHWFKFDPNIAKMVFPGFKWIRNPILSKSLNRYVVSIILDGYEKTTTLARFIKSIIEERSLSRDEEVHHIDGNTLNDCPDNLEIINRYDHLMLHRNKAEYCKVECIMCGKEFERRASRIRISNKNKKPGPFCGRKCVGKHIRLKKEDEVYALQVQPGPENYEIVIR